MSKNQKRMPAMGNVRFYHLVERMRNDEDFLRGGKWTIPLLQDRYGNSSDNHISVKSVRSALALLEVPFPRRQGKVQQNKAIGLHKRTLIRLVNVVGVIYHDLYGVADSSLTALENELRQILTPPTQEPDNTPNSNGEAK